MKHEINQLGLIDNGELENIHRDGRKEEQLCVSECDYKLLLCGHK